MARHAGYSRWIWNWGLRMWTETYQAGLKPTASKLRKFYTCLGLSFVVTP